jgi:hypothetical protein
MIGPARVLIICMVATCIAAVGLLYTMPVGP